MKNKNFTWPLMLFAALTFASCGSGEKKTEENATTEGAAKAPQELTDMTGVTSYYECPMKCEGKKFVEAGACPVCGMDIVLVELKVDTAATTADTTRQM